MSQSQVQELQRRVDALLRENADLRRVNEELRRENETLKKSGVAVVSPSSDSLQPMRELMKRRSPSPVKKDGKEGKEGGKPPEETSHGKALRMREKVVEEVVATEKVYVENLHVLHSLFHNALLATLQGYEHEQALTQEQFDRIFGNSTSIMQLNQDFLDALLEKREHWNPETSTIGDVFLRFKDLFKLYGPYCSGYKAACELVKQLQSSSAQFRDLMALIAKLPEVKHLDLVSFLALPFQRITRYHLLLNELYKHTPVAHPDHALIEKSLHGYRDIATVCNSKVDRSERGAQIVRIASQLTGFPGVLLDPARVFVKEGTFHKITSTLVTSDWHFLFNDMLVYCRRTSETSFAFKGAIALAECWIRDLPDTAQVRNLFQLVAPKKTYVYQFDSAEDKASWMAAMQDCINKLVEIDPTVVLRRGEVKARQLNVLGSLLSYAPEQIDPTTMDELPLDLEEVDEFVLITSRGQSTVNAIDALVVAAPPAISVQATSVEAPPAKPSTPSPTDVPPVQPVAAAPPPPPLNNNNNEPALDEPAFNDVNYWSLPVRE